MLLCHIAEIIRGGDMPALPPVTTAILTPSLPVIVILLSIALVAASDNIVFNVTYGTERGGTFAKRSPSPSDIVGCARIASRSFG